MSDGHLAQSLAALQTDILEKVAYGEPLVSIYV